MYVIIYSKQRGKTTVAVGLYKNTKPSFLTGRLCVLLFENVGSDIVDTVGSYRKFLLYLPFYPFITSIMAPQSSRIISGTTSEVFRSSRVASPERTRTLTAPALTPLLTSV